MTSSPSSSETSSVSSSTKLSPTLSKYNFNPFAVHPFTSCTSPNHNGNAPTANHNLGDSSSAYSYRQTLGNYPTRAPISSPPDNNTIPSHQQPPSSPPKAYGYTPPRTTGIFVPFRKETSSPELSDILKSKSPSDMMIPTPKMPGSFIPTTPSVVPSSSWKQ